MLSLSYEQLTVSSCSAQCGLGSAWIGGWFAHLCWQGNYSLWLFNPILYAAVGHGVADPHNSSLGLASLATAPTSDLSVVSQAAGLYHLLATLGFVQEQQIYTAVVLLECFACLCLAIGCCGSFTGSYSWDTSVLDIAQGSWLRCVSLSTLGLVCLAWAGHLVHVAVPQSRGVISDFTNISGSVASPIGLRALCLADWFVEQAKRYSRGQHS